MIQISAKVIADSKNEFGNRITSMIVTMPRYILAEFNTHRMFSRNSASSRAIPFEKMLKSVQENPFIPMKWMKDHKGMQGTEYFTDKNQISILEQEWLIARDNALKQAIRLSSGIVLRNDWEEEESYSKKGLTKQIVNRLLEPFMYHTVIVTATEWENFFALRCPQYVFPTGKGEVEFRSKADAMKSYTVNEHFPNMDIDNTSYTDWAKFNRGQADIHMMATAEVMWDAYNESQPKELKVGEWHIPFGENMDINNLISVHPDNFGTENEINEIKIKIATARCARVSYTVVGEEDKKDNYENDIKLHNRLAESGHWSPFEHCAKAMGEIEYSSSGYTHTWMNQENTKQIGQVGWSGNFRGWIQYRKMIPNENITK